MILGYIITNRTLKIKLNFIQVVSDYNDITDFSKPILIIGLENAKKYIVNFSILRKKITDTLFWTFNKNEKKDDYENDIKNFYQYILNRELDKIKYYYINVFTLTYSKIKSLIYYLKNSTKKYICFYDNMIYIYSDRTILGFSIKMMKYCNIHYENFFNKLKNNNNYIIEYNSLFIDLSLKSFIKDKYKIAYLLFLFNNK